MAMNQSVFDEISIFLDVSLSKYNLVSSIQQKYANSKDQKNIDQSLNSESIQQNPSLSLKSTKSRKEVRNKNINAKQSKNKKKYQRKKNQNRFKQFHSIAYKTLKNLLSIGKISILEKYRHRHDYLVMIMIVADLMGIFTKFSQLFHMKIQTKLIQLEKCYLQISKNNIVESQLQNIISSMRRALNSLQKFSEGKVSNAVQQLYQIYDLKNINYFFLAQRDMINLMEISINLKKQSVETLQRAQKPIKLLTIFRTKNRVNKQ